MKSQILDLLCSVASQPGVYVSNRKKRALENMRDCKTTRYGGRVVECPHCGKIKVIYNPCNQRGCPICHKRNQKLWEHRALKSLLQTNHLHLVFSIPQEYTFVWFRYKKEFMNAFFECVKKAIASISEKTGITPGCVAVFQSHGKGMVYKPHIHCALTAGGITADGTWVPSGSISYRDLAAVVQENFNRELVKKEIPESELPKAFEVNNREWTVYATYYQDSAEKIIGYLSHAAAGVVINLKQKFHIDELKKTIRFTENHGGKDVRTELTQKVFTERYLNHIPPEHAVTIRYYGLYSNQYAERLKELQEQFPVNVHDEDPELVDICPDCHMPMTLIKKLEPYEVVMTIDEFDESEPPDKTKSISIISSALF